MNKGFWKLSLACVLVLGCLTTVPALAQNDNESDNRPPHKHAVRDTNKNDSVRPEHHRPSTDKDGTVRGERRHRSDKDSTVNKDRRHRFDKDSTVNKDRRHRFDKDSTVNKDRRHRYDKDSTINKDRRHRYDKDNTVDKNRRYHYSDKDRTADKNHRHRYSDGRNSTRTNERRNYSENTRNNRYRDDDYNYNGNVRNDNRYNDFTGTKTRVRRGYTQDGREVEIIDYGNTRNSNSRYSRGGRYSRDRTVDRITSDLNLSDSQKRRMEPYIRDMYDRFDKSSVDNNSRDYNNSRNREAFRNFKDRVSPNLTDEQRKKLDRMDIRDILR